MVYRQRLNKVPRFVCNHLKKSLSIITVADFFFPINFAVMLSINEFGHFIAFQAEKRHN